MSLKENQAATKQTFGFKWDEKYENMENVAFNYA